VPRAPAAVPEQGRVPGWAAHVPAVALPVAAVPAVEVASAVAPAVEVASAVVPAVVHRLPAFGAAPVVEAVLPSGVRDDVVGTSRSSSRRS
jgi:hypothetical protein